MSFAVRLIPVACLAVVLLGLNPAAFVRADSAYSVQTTAIDLSSLGCSAPLSLASPGTTQPSAVPLCFNCSHNVYCVEWGVVAPVLVLQTTAYNGTSSWSLSHFSQSGRTLNVTVCNQSASPVCHDLRVDAISTEMLLVSSNTTVPAAASSSDVVGCTGDRLNDVDFVGSTDVPCTIAQWPLGDITLLRPTTSTLSAKQATCAEKRIGFPACGCQQGHDIIASCWACLDGYLMDGNNNCQLCPAKTNTLQSFTTIDSVSGQCVWVCIAPSLDSSVSCAQCKDRLKNPSTLCQTLLPTTTGLPIPTTPSTLPPTTTTTTAAPVAQCFNDGILLPNVPSANSGGLTVGSGGTCVCVQQWTGPTCEVCPVNAKSTAGGTACNSCKPGWFGVGAQSCAQPCSTATANGRCLFPPTVKSVAGEQRCECVAGCRNRWTGLLCGTCPAGVNASSDCTVCEAGLYGAACDQVCSITDRGCDPKRTLSVEVDAARTTCQCNCAGGATGSTCGQCVAGFDPLKECQDCMKGYYPPRTCTTLCNDADTCNGRGTAVWKINKCSCVCTPAYNASTNCKTVRSCWNEDGTCAAGCLLRPATGNCEPCSPMNFTGASTTAVMRGQCLITACAWPYTVSSDGKQCTCDAGRFLSCASPVQCQPGYGNEDNKCDPGPNMICPSKKGSRCLPMCPKDPGVASASARQGGKELTTCGNRHVIYIWGDPHVVMTCGNGVDIQWSGWILVYHQSYFQVWVLAEPCGGATCSQKVAMFANDVVVLADRRSSVIYSGYAGLDTDYPPRNLVVNEKQTFGTGFFTIDVHRVNDRTWDMWTRTGLTVRIFWDWSLAHILVSMPSSATAGADPGGASGGGAGGAVGICGRLGFCGSGAPYVHADGSPAVIPPASEFLIANYPFTTRNAAHRFLQQNDRFSLPGSEEAPKNVSAETVNGTCPDRMLNLTMNQTAAIEDVCGGIDNACACSAALDQQAGIAPFNPQRPAPICPDGTVRYEANENVSACVPCSCAVSSIQNVTAEGCVCPLTWAALSPTITIAIIVVSCTIVAAIGVASFVAYRCGACRRRRVADDVDHKSGTDDLARDNGMRLSTSGSDDAGFTSINSPDVAVGQEMRQPAADGHDDSVADGGDGGSDEGAADPHEDRAVLPPHVPDKN